MAKTILFDATSARHTYESLWDVALVHANDLINYLPEAGSDSPVVVLEAQSSLSGLPSKFSAVVFMPIKMLFEKMDRPPVSRHSLSS